MDAGHHVIEPGQHIVGIVERAIRQDIALGSFEDVELAAEGLVELVDLRPLRPDALDTQPAGIARRSRMVGDSQVLQATIARCRRHFRERGRSIAPVGVAMKGTGQIVELDEFGEIPRFRGIDLAGILAELGRDLSQTQRREELGLGPAGDRCVLARQGIFIQGQSARSARRRMAML